MDATQVSEKIHTSNIIRPSAMMHNPSSQLKLNMVLKARSTQYLTLQVSIFVFF